MSIKPNRNPQKSATASPFKRAAIMVCVGLATAMVVLLPRHGAIVSRWLDEAGRTEIDTNRAKVNTAPVVVDWAKQIQGRVLDVEPPAAPSGNDSSVSSTPLDLLLTATRPGRNSREGSADIGVVKNTPQTFVAGALLANGARLVEIRSDSVLLEKNGQSTRLYLPGHGALTKLLQADSELLTVGGTSLPPPAVVTSHEELTDYIRPTPIYDGDSLQGFQVYPTRTSSVFYQLGLKPGDVIMTIDGIALVDSTTAIGQFDRLARGEVVNAKVKRSNTPITLRLDGSIVTAARAQSASKLPL